MLMWSKLQKDQNRGGGLVAKVARTGMLSVLAIFWSVVHSPATAHENIAELVARIQPAVVSIRIEFTDTQNRSAVGTRGSGFLISGDGWVVTNDHVIDGASEIYVELQSGASYEAAVKGTDPNTDLALLQIEAENGEEFPSVSFGDSSKVRVGETVIAIGNPFGLGFSVSRGIISAGNRYLGGPFDDYLQTDAAINQGNSGGPLFNTKGEVIGVNTAIIPSSRGLVQNERDVGSLGIGFSMASNVVQDVVQHLIEHGEVRRGWLGVAIQSLTDEIREAIGLEDIEGTLVADVFAGTPAEKAGIKVGDIITGFNGTAIESAGDLPKLVGQAAPGEEASVTILRGTEEIMLTVVLDLREVGIERARSTTQNSIPGVTLDEIDPETRQKFSLDESVTGVVISDVQMDSVAYEQGIRAGNILKRINLVAVKSIEDVEAAIADAREKENNNVLLLIKDSERTTFIALSLTDE